MSELKATGTITHIDDVQSGTSKAGKDWKKVTFRIDTKAEYNNVIQFDLFGTEKVDKFLEYNKVGKEVEVSFNVECKEFKGRYFTNLSAWKVWGLESEKVTEPVETNADEGDMPF